MARLPSYASSSERVPIQGRPSTSHPTSLTIAERLPDAPLPKILSIPAPSAERSRAAEVGAGTRTRASWATRYVVPAHGRRISGVVCLSECRVDDLLRSAVRKSILDNRVFQFPIVLR